MGIGVLLLTLAGGLIVYASRVSAPKEPIPQEIGQTGTVSLTVAGLYENRRVSISSGETVLQVLQKIDAQDPLLELSTKEYSGLGALVDGMHGNKNGADNKYWQYKVNGVMPQVGAGELKLKSGDSVEWFFGPSEF